ncbi:hypothetical protein PR048_006980 [Dryococelus australis]|uniref:Uncharacterized protein n=1 Tax=Dryococelus australis TaxID=614101 RepID=A0ABQ9IDE7_9NEOP|nr:hypothetical protein PR048_006980 [Dryococelus australis]
MTNTTHKNTIICNIENILSDNCEVLTTICRRSYECIVINYIKVANLLKTKLGNLTVENKDTNPNKHMKRNNSNIKLELGELNRLTMLKHS